MTWSGYLEKVSIKQPVPYFFSNSRSLEQPGLIIETLEYCHVNFLECNLMISFGKKVGKNDDLRWEMPFCLQISPVNILQSEADKDLKYFIIGTRNF